MSIEIVSLTSLSDNHPPKAFGECVFRATKLSVSKNKICTNERMRKHWLSSSNGKVNFRNKLLVLIQNNKSLCYGR